MRNEYDVSIGSWQKIAGKLTSVFTFFVLKKKAKMSYHVSEEELIEEFSEFGIEIENADVILKRNYFLKSILAL